MMARKSDRARPDVSTKQELWRAFVLGTVPLVLGAAGVLLSPLRTVIAQLIWTESASLVMTLPRSVYEGDEFDVQILVYPTSPVEISAGILELEPTNELVNRLAGASHLDIPAIVNPSVLNKTSPDRFVAVGPGISGVKARLRTRNGIYETSQSIEIRARESTGSPTRRNFTGRWAVTVGPYRGQMEITEQGATINGRYSLDDGTRGVVDGIRDGTAYHATYYRGNSPTKWVVVGETRAADEYVEIKGNATLYTVDARGWRASGDAQTFYAVARVEK
jgi:hypothetical protein